jgi:hypothetical protein
VPITFRSGMVRAYRYLAIGLCSFPLITSLAISWGAELHTPSCPIRHWLGVICPSCGLTRSFVALASGRIDLALDYHLFGPIIFVGLAIAIGHCLYELKYGQPIRSFYSAWLTRPPVVLSLLGSFCGYYLLRLLQIIPTTQL